VFSSTRKGRASKAAVQNIAQQEGIRVRHFGELSSIRVVTDDKNWWGTAKAFQVTSPDPFSIANKNPYEKRNY